MISKICFKCKIEWPLDNFYRHPGMSDGHLNKCKNCNKKDVIENRNNNIDYYREYDAKRTQDPERRERNTKYSANYRKEHPERRKETCNNYIKKYPERYKANYTLTNAVRDKKIFRKPCYVCGDLKSQAHHHDYSKPLDVVWVCAVHHAALENRNKKY